MDKSSGDFVSDLETEIIALDAIGVAEAALAYWRSGEYSLGAAITVLIVAGRQAERSCIDSWHPWFNRLQDGGES
jgi:hypothetical protein